MKPKQGQADTFACKKKAVRWIQLQITRYGNLDIQQGQVTIMKCRGLQL